MLEQKITVNSTFLSYLYFLLPLPTVTKVPTPFDETCSQGSVHLTWQLPVTTPISYPVTDFRVVASCLHGNDSQVFVDCP